MRHKESKLLSQGIESKQKRCIDDENAGRFFGGGTYGATDVLRFAVGRTSDGYALRVSACQNLMAAVAGRTDRYGVLILLDLGNFKQLDDPHGHDMGDLLLVEVTKRIGNCICKVDTVARLGGDEFVVLLFRNYAESVDELLKRADTAMYRAKQAERDQVYFDR